jgi:PAS domain S-box-containing protein
MSSNGGLTTLLVEDESSQRWLFSEILRSRGHTVTSCEDGEAAWTAFQDRHYPLILLDWVLPGADGLEICRRIRRHRRGKDCVIIIITGKDNPEALEEVLSAGADDYITKPVDLGLLNVRLALAERDVKELSQRQATADALEKATGELRALFENLNEVVFSVDARHQTLTQVSPASASVFGVAPRVLLSRTDLWPEFLYPEPWKGLKKRLEEVAPGQSLDAEYEIRRPDGEIRWVRARIKPERGPGGSILRLDGLVADQTDAVRDRMERDFAQESMKTTLRVADELLAGGEFPAVCARVLEELCDSTGMAFGDISLVEPASGDLVVQAAVGTEGRPEPGTRIPGQGLLAGEVARSGEGVLCLDTRKHPSARHTVQGVLGVHWAVAVPIRRDEKLVGVLSLSDDTPTEPPPTLLSLAQDVAHRLGLIAP